jgi:hypothetical protein
MRPLRQFAASSSLAGIRVFNEKFAAWPYGSKLFASVWPCGAKSEAERWNRASGVESAAKRRDARPDRSTRGKPRRARVLATGADKRRAGCGTPAVQRKELKMRVGRGGATFNGNCRSRLFSMSLRDFESLAPLLDGTFDFRFAIGFRRWHGRAFLSQWRRAAAHR